MDDINSNSIEQLSDTDIEMLYNDVLESGESIMLAKCYKTSCEPCFCNSSHYNDCRNDYSTYAGYWLYTGYSKVNCEVKN